MGIIEKNIDSLQRLCTEHYVEKMYVFGSVLNDSFNIQSDIDFLVKFKQIDLSHYFDNYLSFKDKLKTLLGIEVDLLEEQTLRNPILIDSINKSKKLIYG